MKNTPSRKPLQLLQDARKQLIKLVADANYTVFHLGDGKSAVMSYSLKNYQNYLNYPFVRVSKSCIVNLHTANIKNPTQRWLEDTNFTKTI